MKAFPRQKGRLVTVSLPKSYLKVIQLWDFLLIVLLLINPLEKRRFSLI